MLPIRSSRELGRLQYLEADQPEQDDAKAGEKKMQQNVSPAPRRTHDYFAPPTGNIVRAIRNCSAGGVAKSGLSGCGWTMKTCPCCGGISPNLSVATLAIRSGAVSAENLTCS
jgi:hypothetical protein